MIISCGVRMQFGRNGKNFPLARVFMEDWSITQKVLRLLSTRRKNNVKSELGSGKLGWESVQEGWKSPANLKGKLLGPEAQAGRKRSLLQGWDVHSFNNYLPYSYCVSGTVLGKDLRPPGTYFPTRRNKESRSVNKIFKSMSS